MNRDDRNVFLADIKDCVPDKFAIAWPQIASLEEEWFFKLKNNGSPGGI